MKGDADDPSTDQAREHEVTTCYAGGPGVRYFMPFMSCSCGWSSDRQDTFEECGALLDEHLGDVGVND